MQDNRCFLGLAKRSIAWKLKTVNSTGGNNERAENEESEKRPPITKADAEKQQVQTFIEVNMGSVRLLCKK